MVLGAMRDEAAAGWPRPVVDDARARRSAKNLVVDFPFGGVGWWKYTVMERMRAIVLSFLLIVGRSSLQSWIQQVSELS